MQVVSARCAGLDVHKKTVSACVSVCEPDVGKKQQMRVFGTCTSDLLALVDWLKKNGVAHVVMEATGVYWRPVWALMEGQFEQMMCPPNTSKRRRGASGMPRTASGSPTCCSMGCSRGALCR